MSTSRRKNEFRLTSDIVRLSRIYRKKVSRALTAFGISDSQSIPVLHIARHGDGMRQNRLAEELGMEGPSLVRMLHQLCTSGLVERRDDSSDKRAKNLHLTESGQALATEVEKALNQIRRQLLKSVTDEDLSAALRVLAVLDKEIDSMDAPLKEERN